MRTIDGCLFVCCQVKADVFAVTDVPVRHQQWTGWPNAATDETVSSLLCPTID